MGDWMYYIVGGAAVLIIILIIIATVMLKKHKYKKLGIDGERKVAKKLKKFAGIRGFKVINDIYLSLYDKTTQIDHILIGFFGILVVETKNLAGEVYADPRKKEWLHIVKDKRRTLYNPLMQNQTHIDCIRYIFGKENIYNVAIDSLVVFTNKKTVVFNSRGLPIIKLNLLRKYLKKPRYSKDNNVDVQKLYDTLKKYEVTDKKVISKHVKGVKEMAKNK